MSRREVYWDYVQDMLESAEKALRFVEGMDFQHFSEDEKTVYAVIRAIEIIGEAARNIPKKLKGMYSEIPWREISGARKKINP
jgi:uncharacterized protein with HEPN domain